MKLRAIITIEIPETDFNEDVTQESVLEEFKQLNRLSEPSGPDDFLGNHVQVVLEEWVYGQKILERWQPIKD